MVSAPKNQFGILELIAPLIEAWWVILITCLSAGGAAYYASGPVATHYETRVVVDVPSRIIGELVSPAVLASKNVSSPAAISVTTSEGTRPRTTSIVIHAKSAADAEAAATNIASYTENHFDPYSPQLQVLQSKLKVYGEARATIRDAMQQIKAAPPRKTSSEDREVLANYVDAVANLTREFREQNLQMIEIQARIDTLPTAKVIFKSSVAEPNLVSRSALVPFAVLGALLLTVLLIALRESLTHAAASSPASPGLERIRRALPKWAVRE